MTQSHSRSKRVLPRHIIATLAISGASVAGMAAPSFAGETPQTPDAHGTAGAAVKEALAKTPLANLPQADDGTPRDGEDKRTPPGDGEADKGGNENGNGGQAGDNGGENGQGGNGGQDNNGQGGGGQAGNDGNGGGQAGDNGNDGNGGGQAGDNGQGDNGTPSPSTPSGQPSSGSPSAQDPKSPGDPSQSGTSSPSDNKVPGLNTGTPQKTGAENGGDHGVAPNQQDPGASVPVVPSPRAGSGQKSSVSGTQLPRTGASVTTLAAVAVAAAGTGGVLVARRRRAY